MFKNKRASEAVTALILFVAVVGISTALVVSFKNFAFETQASLDVQNDAINNQLRTALSIVNIAYNSSTNYTSVYLKNVGTSKLITEDFDFFLDDEYITNFTVREAGNLSASMQVLQPQETAVFRVQKYLVSGTHEVKMVSNYGGNGDTDYFNN